MRRYSLANPRRDPRPPEYHVLRDFALSPFRFTADDRTLSAEHIEDWAEIWTRHSRPFRVHLNSQAFGRLAQQYPAAMNVLRERVLKTGSSVLDELQAMFLHAIVETVDKEPLQRLGSTFLSALATLHATWRDVIDLELNQSAYDALRRLLPAAIASDFGPTVEMSRVWLWACLRVVECVLYDVYHVFAIEFNVIDDAEATANGLRYSLEQLGVECSECKNVHDFVFKYHDFISSGLEPGADTDDDDEGRGNDKGWVRPSVRVPKDLTSLSILELVEILESMHADYSDCIERKEYLVHRIRSVELYLNRPDVQQRQSAGTPPRKMSVSVRQAARIPMLVSGFVNGLQAVRCSHDSDKYTLCPRCHAARYCTRPMCKEAHDRGCRELQSREKDNAPGGSPPQQKDGYSNNGNGGGGGNHRESPPPSRARPFLASSTGANTAAAAAANATAFGARRSPPRIANGSSPSVSVSTTSTAADREHRGLVKSPSASSTSSREERSPGMLVSFSISSRSPQAGSSSGGHAAGSTTHSSTAPPAIGSASPAPLRGDQQQQQQQQQRPSTAPTGPGAARPGSANGSRPGSRSGSRPGSSRGQRRTMAQSDSLEAIRTSSSSASGQRPSTPSSSSRDRDPANLGFALSSARMRWSRTETPFERRDRINRQRPATR